MILLDANLLIYAVNRDAPLHRPAKAWLEKTLSEGEIVGLCWPVLLAFIRLTTRPGLFSQPLPLEAALDLVAKWLAWPSVQVVEPTGRHLHVLRGLLTSLGTGGNLVSDAHLAALAIEHGALLCSTDGDFARFGGLRWLNPLA
jgi:toxin-antitoxin system PIN domain toxin